ncbi:MAG: hypothetical protein IJH65_03775 [Methanobrevibacter sp.]|nr:hypothetical protein [Methanobrevibacter sp.]
MSTLSNIMKIIADLDQVSDKKDYYLNIEERLDKVLNNYLKNLDYQYNRIIDTNNLSGVMKELIK